MQTTPSFEKQIQYDHGDYKMTLDGRVIGWAATYSQAEVVLNQVVYEMLTHGDCATATELDAPIADEAVQLVNWNSAAARADPPPDDAPGHDEDGVPHALILQTLLDRQRRGVCVPCGGAHRSQQCPEVTQRLFAPLDDYATCASCGDLHSCNSADPLPFVCSACRKWSDGWKDIALGRELCRMRWHNFGGFVTLLKSVSATGDLTVYAESYQAFIRDHSPDSDMSIAQVLQAWGRLISGEQQRAA